MYILHFIVVVVAGAAVGLTFVCKFSNALQLCHAGRRERTMNTNNILVREMKTQLFISFSLHFLHRMYVTVDMEQTIIALRIQQKFKIH